MKIIFTIIISIYTFKTFSQAKNCNTVNIGPNRCEYEIWKEKSDTIFCIVKAKGPLGNKNEECDYFRYDLGQNKTWMIYSADTLTLFEKLTIKDSLYEGESLKYYKNGNLKEKAFYVNGKLDGKYFSYYKNAKIREYIDYKNGEINGSSIVYYENGYIESTSNYCDGHFIRVSYKYWDNERLASVIFYGENLKYIVENPINMYFDPNGNSISVFEFKQMWDCNYW